MKDEIFNHYKIEKKLGEGGMGVVYKAYDTKLGRVVALKTLLPSGPKHIERFVQETRSLAKVKHANIVEIYEVGEKPCSYFTMEYVDGLNYATLVKSGRLEIAEIVIILEKVAQALYVAHKKGIIHRDIKPSNIMVNKNMQPKVMDFGLAKILHSNAKISNHGDTMGTLCYIPPEQAMGEKVDKRSDIYSLGATIYESLTGQPPFRGTEYQIIRQITRQHPVEPCTLNPNIPKELEAICLKCLEKKPNMRYQNARALARDLRNFLENRPVAAKPDSSFIRAKKFLLRNKKTFMLAVPLMLAMTAAPAIQQKRMNSIQREAKYLCSQAKKQSNFERQMRRNIENDNARLKKRLRQHMNAYMQLGIFYYEAKNYQKALECCRECIKLDPGFANAYYNAGIIYYELQDYQKSMECYQRALKYDPENASIYNNMGTTCIALHKYRKGIDYYQKALLIKPGKAASNNGLGSIYYYLENYRKSLSFYQKTIEAMPDCIEAYYGMGLDCFCLEDYENAARYFRKIIQINPSYPNPYYQLARVFSQRNEREQALTWLEKALAAGYRDFASMDKDRVIDNIRNEKRFAELMQKYRK